nr:hypothetical protein [Tanacetum cinerariifolium]
SLHCSTRTWETVTSFKILHARWAMLAALLLPYRPFISFKSCKSSFPIGAFISILGLPMYHIYGVKGYRYGRPGWPERNVVWIFKWFLVSSKFVRDPAQRKTPLVLPWERIPRLDSDVLMEPKTALENKYKKLFQMNDIPHAKTGNERVDAVVIDEESGGKILRGDGALEKLSCTYEV